MMKMGIVYAETLPDEYGAYEIVWGDMLEQKGNYLRIREARIVTISQNGSGPVASKVFGPEMELWYRIDRLKPESLEIHA